MSANLVFLIVFALTVVGTMALNAASVKWGLKWTSIAQLSILKAFGIYLVFAVVSVLVGIAATLILLLVSRNQSDLAFHLIGYPATLVTPTIVIALIYKVPWRKALLASLPFLVLAIAVPLAFAFIIRAYVYQAFVIPANAMAPTLLGNHFTTTCPKCGQPAYGSLPNSQTSLTTEDVLVVCSKEMQSVYVNTVPTDISGGDRILVCKLLKPKRWDMIVFRYPEDPTYFYVMRLVGLPGERLSIREGGVWINDALIERPPSLAGIQYSPTIEINGGSFSGPGSVPVQLGTDEYFVLGDFVDNSADSRLWQHGAPGHPPYAVPTENLVGVVINIYWPPSRWKAFR